MRRRSLLGRWTRISLALAVTASALTAVTVGARDADAGTIAFPVIPTGQSTQSHATLYRATFQPGQPYADVPMESVNDSVCLLTGLQGRQRGQSLVGVHRLTAGPGTAEIAPGSMTGLAQGDTWHLWAASYHQRDIWGGTDSSSLEREAPVAGGATCVPRSAFVTDPKSVIWTSDLQVADQVTGFSWTSKCNNYPPDVSRDLWWGNAVSALSIVRADMGSFRDTVDIADGGTPLTPRKLKLHNTQCLAQHSVAATSLFVGLENQNAYPNLVGYKKQTLRAGRGRSAEVPMAATRDGICYFTGLSGNWDGHGEAAWIAPQMIGDTEYWTARVNAGSGGEVQATVQCLGYDQRLRDQVPDGFGG